MSSGSATATTTAANTAAVLYRPPQWQRGKHPVTGYLKARKFFGGRLRLVISPDATMWLMPTTLSAALAAGAFWAAGDVPSTLETLIFLSLVGTAFTCSLLVCVTDPGIIPIPAPPHRPDPYAQEHPSWRECRYCGVNQPPRSSHCYTCGVCVMEHDHHCGVVGGCVGLRSMRFFASYLVTISAASCHALTWIIRSWIRLTNAEAQRLSQPVAQQGNGPSAFSQSPQMAIHLMVGIFIANIALVVGGLGCYYMYLVGSDTTRREAQGKRQKSSAASSSAGLSSASWRTTSNASTANHLYHVEDAAGGDGTAASNRGELLEDNASGSGDDFLPPVPYHERRRLPAGRWSRWVMTHTGNFGRVFFPPPSLLDDIPQAWMPTDQAVAYVALV